MLQHPLEIVAATVLLAGAAVQAQEPAVYRVQLRGSVDRGAVRLVERAVIATHHAPVDALIVELAHALVDLDAADDIVTGFRRATVPVYVLVRSAAADAALLIVLAADSSYLAPDARIGSDSATRPSGEAAEQLRQALQSALRHRSLDPEMADAFVERRAVLPDAAASRLPLSDTAAVRVGLAAGRAGSIEQLLEQVDLADARVSTVDSRWLSATITVANRNWLDVAIFVVRGGQRFRLGTVTSMRTQTFELPETRLPSGSRIQLRVEPIGSSQHLATDLIAVEPGLVVEWDIANVLSQSNYFVWVR